MQYLSFYQKFDNLQETMFGGKICEQAEENMKHRSKKVKRYRSAFTTGQINYLEKQFQQCPYIGNAIRKDVANTLNIPERAIKIWFQNRRMKEKKEVINKEYNLDRQNISINNVNLTNDTLNNVRSSQSANDRHYSSPSAMLCNKDSKINNSDNVQIKANIQRFDSKQGMPNAKHVNSNNFKNVNIVNNDRYNNNNCQKIFSSEFSNKSKCNLSKIYDNKQFIQYLKNNNIDGGNTNKSTKKVEVGFEHSKNSLVCQDLPEDLSARKKPDMLISQNHPSITNLTTTFIPFCKTQNYFTPCVSEGSIVWKPVNIMPFVSPNNLPFAIPESHVSGINQINTQKSCCNCDCHIKNKFFEERETKSQPKYVIAVPYNQI